MEERECRIGFASPPRYFDSTPSRVRAFFGDRVEVIQTLIHCPEFAFDEGHFRAGWPAYEEAMTALSHAGAGIVVQVGSPFVYFHALEPAALRRRVRALEAMLGVRIVVSGLVLLDALDALGVRNVIVAGMYYAPGWIRAFIRFLGAGGVTARLADTGDQAMRAESETAGWEFSEDRIEETLRLAARDCGGADALVMAGLPGHVGRRVERLERELGLPIASVETATLWRLHQLTRLPLPPGDHGALFRTHPSIKSPISLPE